MVCNNFLIIDTSNYKPFVAFVIDGDVISINFLNKNSLSVNLENSIESFLQKNSNLDFISVCSGPGNFSSIRTGVAFALGLQLSLDIPMVTWDSTIPFVSNSHRIFVNIIDGGKKGCFVSLKEKVKEKIVFKSQLQFMLFDQLLEFLQKSNCFCLVGPYLENVKNFLKFEEKYFFEEKDPDFLFLKNFCFDLFQNKQYSSDDVLVTYLKEIN